MNIKKNICLVFYYFFARHLPASDGAYSFGSKYIRRMLCKNIFDKTGNCFNVEHGAFFGSGTGIRIGTNSGLGLHCRVQGPLTIGDNVMMGPDVLIYTRNHKMDKTDVPKLVEVQLWQQEPS
ncbi:MAG: maltose O-acetyltransferase [Clostridiales bacterium]|nr:maltose O-acetyltransferase [Clostridiales bacterium]